MEHEGIRKVEDDATKLVKSTIPALISGGAGDDPAGIIAYTVVGATTGLSQLWLMLLSTPMLIAATSMAARIALTTRSGLAAVIEKRYGRAPSVVVVVLLIAANLFAISADVAGVASALEILTGIPWHWLVPLVLIGLAITVQQGYERVKAILTLFAFALLAYVAAAFLGRPDWLAVARATFIPQINLQQSWLIAALGLLGATIGPYTLFFQAGEEMEELRAGSVIRASESDRAIIIGMIFSNVVSFFVIVAAAITIHAGGSSINSVTDAAQALMPLGPVGDTLFIIGIVGSGLLALPVLAGSTAYAVAELFGWKEGLGVKIAQARGFYIVLAVSLLGGAAIALLPNFHPALAMYYSQVLSGVLLPLVMFVLLLLSNDRRVVGNSRNPGWINSVAVLTIFVALAALAGAVMS